MPSMVLSAMHEYKKINFQLFQDQDFTPILSGNVEKTFHLMPAVVENNDHRSSRPFLTTGCPRCFQKSKVQYVGYLMALNKNYWN